MNKELCAGRWKSVSEFARFPRKVSSLMTDLQKILIFDGILISMTGLSGFHL